MITVLEAGGLDVLVASTGRGRLMATAVTTEPITKGTKEAMEPALVGATLPQEGFWKPSTGLMLNTTCIILSLPNYPCDDLSAPVPN